MKTPNLLNNYLFGDGVDQGQIIYDHLLEVVRVESPEQVLGRFQALFISGKGYENKKILNVLAEVISENNAEEKFAFLLNRCCHILINRWQLHPQTQQYVPELMRLFDHIPKGVNRNYIRSFSSELQRLVINFIKSDYYRQLNLLSRVISDARQTNSDEKQEVVGNLINRYPYLYSHCMLGSESSVEQQQNVYKVKERSQKTFELTLSKYITYQVRLAQASRNPEIITKSPKIIQPVSNPTLLSDRDLGRTLKQYVGSVENGRTYKDLSNSFIAHTEDIRNYKSFKDDLYEYIVQSVDPKYGQHRFNKRLHETLTNTYPQNNNQQPDEFLKVRTYSKIFNYLIVDSPQNPQHMVFMDLISNMGTTDTIGLFLKIALVCTKVKPYLEKRFSILFNHYESASSETAKWLVKSLEKLNLAFASNFSNLDMSFLRKIYSK